MDDKSKYSLVVQNLGKKYKEKLHSFEILKDINLTIESPEIVAIMGASGSGKSTLLQILGLLDEASCGSIFINGKNTNILSEKEKNMIRNYELGFVYQFHHLLPEFSVLDNVAMPLILRREKKNIARKKALESIKSVNLVERVDYFPSYLSGGERQKIALARALVNLPSFVLADEPTGNLDQNTAKKIFELFSKINKELNISFIIATHDEELTTYAHRVFTLQNGKLILKNSPIK